MIHDAGEVSAYRTELLRRRLHGMATSTTASLRDDVRLEPVARGERWAPSFGQRRLWFLDQLQPGGIAYNMADVAYRIRGPLVVSALAAALTTIADR
ncbi:hypothetical protein, partial [Micromonospora rosaria]